MTIFTLFQFNSLLDHLQQFCQQRRAQIVRALDAGKPDGLWWRRNAVCRQHRIKILLIYIQLSFRAHLEVQTGDRCGSLKIAAHIERQTLLGAQLRFVRHEHGICKGGEFLLQLLKTFHAFIKHVCQLFFKKEGLHKAFPERVDRAQRIFDLGNGLIFHHGRCSHQ